MKLNRQDYLDKMRACWIGKNIGGTMGGPYEWTREFLDIKGFSTEKGEPLPNDDLDLQLVWLRAVEERGIEKVNAQLLGEYWLNFVVGEWNEYGIAKANMRMGLLPPYSGEYNNEIWRNSNGAWIRTELWACLFPGLPEVAIRYAYNDACVDHGMGEGTYAAIFVAALESAAFYENDIRKLIDLGLSYIPEDCRLAKSVRLAIELYEKKNTLREARDKIIESNSDLGWFQAPSNVAFVVLGLLYGEGDYKKSMICAINCGDDTDCTGATIGSIMGIMYGMAGTPADWAEYIGDKIVSVATNSAYPAWAKSIDNLIDRVYKLVPSCMMSLGIFMEYTDGETELEKPSPYFISNKRFSLPSTGLSMDYDLIFAQGRVEMSACEVNPGDEIELKFTFHDTNDHPHQIEIELDLPETWTADKKYAKLFVRRPFEKMEATTTVKVTAGEKVDLKNIIKARISAQSRPTVINSEIIIWGKN